VGGVGPSKPKSRLRRARQKASSSARIKGGSRLKRGAPQALFQSHVLMDNRVKQYSVTGDAGRFIITETVEESNKPFTVVLNWSAVLKR